MHDPRVGRFFAVDPLAVDYPHNSPYAFSENRVLDRNELEGLETGPAYWMALTPAAKSAGMTPQMFEKQNSSVVGRKLLEAFKEKVLKANRRAESMSTFYKQHEYLLNRDEKLTFGTAQIYFGSYFTEFAGFTDAEDVSVIMEGRTIDGNKAGALDYSLAGVGVFVPFASGGSLKQITKYLKYSDEVIGTVKTTGKVIDKTGKEGKEIITILKEGYDTSKGATNVAKDIVGDLGDDAIEHVGKLGSQKGKVTGYKSADGSKGWRVDWDAVKGAHINWWNGKEKGAVLFKGGENQVNQIINNEAVKTIK